MARFTGTFEDGRRFEVDLASDLNDPRCGGDCPACQHPGSDHSHTYVQRLVATYRIDGVVVTYDEMRDAWNGTWAARGEPFETQRFGKESLRTP